MSDYICINQDIFIILQPEIFKGDIMNVLKEFTIPFVGLKEGMHDYSFEIKDSFFESFEYSEIETGKVHVEVSLERRERMLVFEFKIDGYVDVDCDRCLKAMEYPVKGQERLIVKFGQELREESEEIIVIPETDSHIDISSFIYEYIMLLLPFKRVHPDGDEICSNEVVDKLENHSIQEEDPRWDALKGLKDKFE